MPMTSFSGTRRSKEFILISPVADDGADPPLEEEDVQQWDGRQKFYSAMLTAKLKHNAAQRIHALEIHRVPSLVKAVKENFKP
jgi:hypothetical protein